MGWVGTGGSIYSVLSWVAVAAVPVAGIEAGSFEVLMGVVAKVIILHVADVMATRHRPWYV